MTTISERLRRPLIDGVERMPGTCCAEAADTIDALVAALEDIRLCVSANSVGYAAIRRLDAALALARGETNVT